jgi:CheY-like chemotaxis protein
MTRDDATTTGDGQPMEMVKVKPRKVLVVDDDDIIREVAKVALEVVGGWHVSTAVSGDEAGRLAAADRPDVVLLDVMMPALDGPGTAALLRADPLTREVPVIFLTAKTPLTDEQLSAVPNLVGVITKPFDPMDLAAEIRRLAGWQE